MKKRLTQGNCKALSTRINHFTMILLAFVVVIGLLGCSDQEQITLEELSASYHYTRFLTEKGRE